ncbi:hypothetical protein [Frankia sp. BMG5.23]|uniref:hypothetical protein n=1 Tax=Frankia sp. BMG5.23 TaxID=683305 RepID=UPI000460C8B8|nr:hypothetical protein [Frankia sp. BMG5.23]KDA44546.1 hypothetical protein BMG523Draft_00723 [Frankia sp. BMG5.23]
MHEVDAEAAEVALQDKLNLGSADRAETRQRAARQMKVLDDQRRKLVQMAYADAIPLDLLKTEQDRIGREQLAAQRALAQAETEHEDISETFRQAVTLMRLGPAIYQQATPEIRRMLNRAFLVRIELDVKETGTMLAQPWASMERVVRHTRELRLADMADVTCITEGSGLGPSEGPETTDPGHEDHDRGSSMNPLVDLLRRYSNPTSGYLRDLRTLCTVLDEVDTAPQPSLLGKTGRGRRPAVGKVTDRLSPADIESLIDLYRAGATARALAEKFSISPTSVKTLLRERGVRRSSTPLTAT